MGTVLQTRLDELTAEVQRLKGILEALPLNTTSTQTAADDGVDMAWKLTYTKADGMLTHIRSSSWKTRRSPR